MRAVLISRTKIVIFVFLVNFWTVEILVGKLLLEGQGNHWGRVSSRVGLNFGLQWCTTWGPSLIWNKSLMKIQTIEQNPLNAWSDSVKKNRPRAFFKYWLHTHTRNSFVLFHIGIGCPKLILCLKSTGP